jgi:adenine-specific DNA-methyltransferase
VDHIREGRTAVDCFTRFCSKSGFPLTTPVEKLPPLAARQSIAFRAEQCSLPRKRGDVGGDPRHGFDERVVCLDSSFAGHDPLKANAVQIFKTKGVTSFKTV